MSISHTYCSLSLSLSRSLSLSPMHVSTCLFIINRTAGFCVFCEINIATELSFRSLHGFACNRELCSAVCSHKGPWCRHILHLTVGCASSHSIQSSDRRCLGECRLPEENRMQENRGYGRRRKLKTIRRIKDILKNLIIRNFINLNSRYKTADYKTFGSL